MTVEELIKERGLEVELARDARLREERGGKARPVQEPGSDATGEGGGWGIRLPGEGPIRGAFDAITGMGPVGLGRQVATDDNARRAFLDTINIPTAGISGGVEQLLRSAVSGRSIEDVRKTMRDERADLSTIQRVGSTAAGAALSMIPISKGLQGAAAGAKALPAALRNIPGVQQTGKFLTRNSFGRNVVAPGAGAAALGVSEGVGSGETNMDNALQTALLSGGAGAALGGILGYGASALKKIGKSGRAKKLMETPNLVDETLASTSSTRMAPNPFEEASEGMLDMFDAPGPGMANPIEKKLGRQAGTYKLDDFVRDIGSVPEGKILSETVTAPGGRTLPLFKDFLDRVSTTPDRRIYAKTADLMGKRLSSYDDTAMSLINSHLISPFGTRRTLGQYQNEAQRASKSVSKWLDGYKTRTQNDVNKWLDGDRFYETLSNLFSASPSKEGTEAISKGLVPLGDEIRRRFREQVLKASARAHPKFRNLSPDQFEETFNSMTDPQIYLALERKLQPGAVLNFRHQIGDIVEDVATSSSAVKTASQGEVIKLRDSLTELLGPKSPGNPRYYLNKLERARSSEENFEEGAKAFQQMEASDFASLLQDLKKKYKGADRVKFDAFVDGAFSNLRQSRDRSGAEGFINFLGGITDKGRSLRTAEDAQKKIKDLFRLGVDQDGSKVFDEFIEDLADLHAQNLAAEKFFEAYGASREAFEMPAAERYLREGIDSLFALGPGSVGNVSMTGRISAIREIVGRNARDNTSGPADVLFDYMVGTTRPEAEPLGIPDPYGFSMNNIQQAAGNIQFGPTVAGTAGGAGLLDASVFDPQPTDVEMLK